MTNSFCSINVGPPDSGSASSAHFAALAGETYWVAVDGIHNAQGNVTVNLRSEPAAVPVIRRQPADQVIGAGAVAAFTVEVDVPLVHSFQWLRDDAPLVDDGVHICGAGTPQLLLLGVTAEDIGDYRVVVENVAGREYSCDARLRVDLPFVLQAAKDPEAPLLGLSLLLNGRVGGSYHLEVSHDLETWRLWTNVVNADGALRFPVQTDPLTPVGVYRAVHIP